jgi:hypothetical protein
MYLMCIFVLTKTNLKMTSIIIYLFLAIVNLPFALHKKSKVRTFSWFVIGFQMGLLTSHIVRYGMN